MTSPPLPRWFGPRAGADDPAVAALIDRVAAGDVWTDLGGAFNLNVRIDAAPPVVLRVHRPWVRRRRVAGLRRLRERLRHTPVRVAHPTTRVSGRDLVRVADRWAETSMSAAHRALRASPRLGTTRASTAKARTLPSALQWWGGRSRGERPGVAGRGPRASDGRAGS